MSESKQKKGNEESGERRPRSKSTTSVSANKKTSTVESLIPTTTTTTTPTTTSGAVQPLPPVRTVGPTVVATEPDSCLLSYGQDLTDVVQVMIYCPKHKKLALTPISETKGLWFPFESVRAGQRWYDKVYVLTKNVLKVRPGGKENKKHLSFTPPVLVHTLRIQIPLYCEYIRGVNRDTCFVIVTVNDKKSSWISWVWVGLKFVVRDVIEVF